MAVSKIAIIIQLKCLFFHVKKMKICYLIQTHKNPEQIYRLIDAIQKSSTNDKIIISHDFTNCDLDIIYLQKLGVKVFSGKGGRGDFLSVQCYLNAIKWLIDNRIKYNWLIYLSGQDYPIKSISKYELFLSETNYDGFLEYFDVFSSESHWSIQEGKSRYLFKYQTIDFLRKIPNWVKQLILPIDISGN